MDHRRSNEDEVHKISTSIFVTNFPDQFSAKDLWKACNQYGRVIDAFIPNRSAISGKRFGFVRFSKTFDVDHLVNNLCTIWIGRHKLHANISRFNKPPLNNSKSQFSAKANSKTVSDDSLKKNGANGYSNSYAHAAKIGHSNSYAHAAKIGHQTHYVEKESKPAIVLDDSCGNQCDFATVLMGKVKELSSLTNLKLVLANEGFDYIKLKYMGGFWVMIEFLSEVAKEKFKDNVAIGSWFSQLQQASNDFLIDERVAWVDIEGVPLKVWSKSTFSRIASKWGDILHIDQEDEVFHSKRICVKTKIVENIYESFKIISKDEDLHDVNEGIHKDNIVDEDSEIEEVVETIFEKESSLVHMKDDSNDDHIEARSEDPFNIYELLNKNKDNNVEGSNSNDSLKYPPGFTPTVASENQSKACNESVVANEEHLQSVLEQKITSVKKKNGSLSNLRDGRDDSVCSGIAQRAKKDWVKELCINNKVNFLSLQETKMEAIELLNVKACWGVWVPSVIIMGDFNEVRIQTERFGSKFNVHGADAFNSFISNAGLEEVPLVKKDNSSKNQKKNLKNELVEIDLILDKGEGNSEVLSKRAEVFKSLHDLNKLESMEMAQKAKIKWAIEGDENSKYFHGILNKKRSQLSIRASRLVLDSNFPCKLDIDQQVDLENNISSEEIKRAVWDCGVDKSPSPDGFTFGFYRRYWSFLKNDVEEAVFNFFQHGTFPKGGNSSFIALIPKTTDAKLVKEFRPITLIGSVYKIIAKILANRLVTVLGDIVNEV
ncbi:RNA-directed DNA polymerase, eukaryota, reverse transcriptase zinc-binding domain protein [Tanacetum coccineum]